MNVWNAYGAKIANRGGTKHGAAYKREVQFLNNHLPDTLSYHNVLIFTPDYGYNIDSDEMRSAAIFQDVSIVDSDNLDEKSIFSLPGEDITHGSLVFWMDNYWLVTEKDANATMYARAKLVQCNYLLRWVTDQNEIIEQWCIVEDGTKYLTGELEDRNFITTRGDSRLSLTIARNSKTAALGRENRFLIDDPESKVKLAYALTKPFKLGGTYQHRGVYKFVLQEVNTTEDDNQDLRIADYYKHFSRTDYPTPGAANSDGGRNWL